SRASANSALRPTPRPHRAAAWPAPSSARTLRRGHPGHPNPEAVMLKEGDLAPDFTLPADDGSEVTLSDLRGRKVVLYFYPKDDTPGCTRQACDLRDRWAEFERTGALVFGIRSEEHTSELQSRENLVCR